MRLARHALGVGFQHAYPAVKSQPNVDTAKNTAGKNIYFQQVTKQQIRRTGQNQQRGDVPEQMLSQTQLILDKAVTNLCKQR